MRSITVGKSQLAKSALSRYRRATSGAGGLRVWHEKTLGQLFDGPSKQIVGMLLAECAAAGMAARRIMTGQDVTEVVQDGGRFAVMAMAAR